MKDCNSHLTHALCQALNTPQMAAYQYLTNLDFVTDASGCRTNFGRIPQADVRFPHVQLFSKLLMEYFKVGRLLGSSNDNNFALFMSPDISEGIEAYKKRVAPWFATAKNLNFATAEDFQDWLNASTRISFMQKASQAPGVPRALQQQYVAAYQKVCADAQANPVPITVARCEVFEEGLRTACAAAAISVNFDKKQSYPQVRALKTDDHTSDIDPVLAAHIKTVLASLNLRQLAARARDHRGGVRGRGIGRDRDGKDLLAAADLSCLWCGRNRRT